MPDKIDRSRPLVMWRQPIEKGGMYVYMYFDDPGIYYAANGAQVPAAFAKELGADVAKFDKERRRKMALADAALKIEKDLAGIAEDEPLPEDVVTKGGFRVVKVGTLGMAVVQDAETHENITQQPVPYALALETLDNLTAAVDDTVLPTPAEKKGTSNGRTSS